jgi:hypothetical protein
MAETKVSPLEQQNLYLCKVSNSADIAITANGWRSLSLNTDIYDPMNMHSTSSNTERIVISEPGYYAFGGVVRFSASTTGGIKIIRYNSGGVNQSGGVMNFESSNRDILNIHGFHYLNTGDYLILQVYTTTGVNATISAEYESNIQFWCYMMSK